MLTEVEKVMSEQKQQQQQQTLPSNSTKNPQLLVSSSNFETNQTDRNSNYLQNENSTIIEAEVDEEKANQTSDRMTQLKELVQMKRETSKTSKFKFKWNRHN